MIHKPVVDAVVDIAGEPAVTLPDAYAKQTRLCSGVSSTRLRMSFSHDDLVPCWLVGYINDAAVVADRRQPEFMYGSGCELDGCGF